MMRTRIREELQLNERKKSCPQLNEGLKNYEVRLQQTKQRNLNIDEYGRPIESVMADLAIAQAGDDGEAIVTFREANKKIAIDVFTRGIRNREVWTVTRARNFKSLSEAINAEKEESVVDERNSIFRMQKWRNAGFQKNGNRDHNVFGSRKQAPFNNTSRNPNFRNTDTNWHTNRHYNDKNRNANGYNYRRNNSTNYQGRSISFDGEVQQKCRFTKSWHNPSVQLKVRAG
ncbi:hypothetical protein FQA39_LY02518 [Lamprigera yunnana]|nr:hypothetical protein FQA39_LY02518 [Lamprigera yunnana]